MKSLIFFLALCFISPEIFSQDEKSVLIHPEIYPSFPGGYDSLKKFINENLKYPYKRQDVEGTFYVQFTVNENGALSDLKVIKGLCDPCDKNALDIFSKMPNWIPGKWYDKPVKMQMVCPVKYSIDK